MSAATESLGKFSSVEAFLRSAVYAEFSAFVLADHESRQNCVDVTEHIDDIIEETGLPTGTVLSQLTLLEIKGYVRHGTGQRFSLNTRKK